MLFQILQKSSIIISILFSIAGVFSLFYTELKKNSKDIKIDSGFYFQKSYVLVSILTSAVLNFKFSFEFKQGLFLCCISILSVTFIFKLLRKERMVTLQKVLIIFLTAVNVLALT